MAEIEKKSMESRIQQAKKPTGEEGVATLERMNQSHEDLTLWALDFLEGEFSSILDIGCGGGATVSRLLNKYPKANKVFGVDYTAEGVELSTEFNKTMIPTRCEISQQNVLDLQFEKETMDLITAFETIYFWEKYELAFQNIRRIMKKGATFLVCCEMSDANNPRWEDAPSYMTLETGTHWKNQLEQAGFSHVTLHSKENSEWFCILAQK